MKLKHVMIDLETLDTLPTAKIVAIGAVAFDPILGKIDNSTFFETIDIKSQSGRSSSAHTLEWWKTQSPEAQDQLEGGTSLEDALDELDFFLPKNCKVWGNGSTFDILILEDAYRQFHIGTPWDFWNVRDCRTVKELFEASRGGNGTTPKKVTHVAVDDALNQAKDVCRAYKRLLNLK